MPPQPSITEAIKCKDQREGRDTRDHLLAAHHTGEENADAYPDRREEEKLHQNTKGRIRYLQLTTAQQTGELRLHIT